MFDKGNGDSDDGFQQQLCLAVSFIQTFHQDKLELWVKGFVEESITAYSSSTDSTSCSKGIKERVVTGLRGIEDPALDQLFAQAEGPKLMHKWLQYCSSALNPTGDTKNKQRLAQQLGITAATTGAEASATFKSLAQKKLAEYQVQNAQDFKTQIDTTAEMIAEYYDTTLKPFAEPDKRSSLPAVSNPAR